MFSLEARSSSYFYSPPLLASTHVSSLTDSHLSKLTLETTILSFLHLIFLFFASSTLHMSFSFFLSSLFSSLLFMYSYAQAAAPSLMPSYLALLMSLPCLSSVLPSIYSLTRPLSPNTQVFSLTHSLLPKLSFEKTTASLLLSYLPLLTSHKFFPLFTPTSIPSQYPCRVTP